MCHRRDDNPECCAKFYPIWCIVVGVLSTPLWISLYFVIGTLIFKWSDIQILRFQILCIVNATFSLSYILAGILMFFGIKSDKRTMFKAGKILSYFFAILNFPICTYIHSMAIRQLCRYDRERWE